MNHCVQCGHELGIGRFCVNCGHPVGEPADPLFERTDTAERPAVDEPDSPLPPPDLPPPEHSARYPLFADQVDDSLDAPPPVLAPEPAAGGSHARRPAWWPWLVGAAVMLLIAALGWSLMFGGDDDPETTAAEPTTGPSEATASEPGPPPTKKPDKPKKPGRPTDLGTQSTATVPATAPPSTDYNGNQVRYDARQMLDGVPSTCWRMPGDGTGETIVVTLPEESTLTSVGLINGYAKTATDRAGNRLDWYAGNRRVLAVEWAFDDGTTVTQDLTETRRLQRLELDEVTTSTIELTLVEVSPPGTGRAKRDYTPISEVSAVGTPA